MRVDLSSAWEVAKAMPLLVRIPMAEPDFSIALIAFSTCSRRPSFEKEFVFWLYLLA
jgi:hypothetical protein